MAIVLMYIVYKLICILCMNEKSSQYKVFDIEDDLYLNGIYKPGDEFKI